DTVFTEMKAEPLPTSPNPDQAINHGVQKLAVHMEDVKEGTLSIWMVPLWNEDELPTETPSVTALKDWSIPDGELMEQPARPQLDHITIDGEELSGFDPYATFYENLIPIDQDRVPVVEVESEYEVTIIPAEQIPGETTIEVVNPETGAASHYVISFTR